MLQRHHTRNHIRKQQFLSQCTSILHDRQAQMLWTSAAVFNYKIKVLKRLKKNKSVNYSRKDYSN